MRTRWRGENRDETRARIRRRGRREVGMDKWIEDVKREAEEKEEK